MQAAKLSQHTLQAACDKMLLSLNCRIFSLENDNSRFIEDKICRAKIAIFLGCCIHMPKIYLGPSEDHQTEQICSAKSCGQTWEYIECGGVVHSIMANICNFSPILYPPPSLQDTGRAFCAAEQYIWYQLSTNYATGHELLTISTIS